MHAFVSFACIRIARACNCMLEHAIECDVFIKTFFVILVSEWRTSGRLERIRLHARAFECIAKEHDSEGS
jgi:hypothetical protein